ncbi:hypothetical protein ACKFKF_00735 [Phormidesmis sp. 146-12]
MGILQFCQNDGQYSYIIFPSSLPNQMSFEIGPFAFAVEATQIAGACLWALALYLGFSPVGEWVTEQLNRWLNFAERSLYTSAEEFEKTRPARESQNAFYASICSILPFLVVGTLCNVVTEISLGESWGISLGILACMGCGIYELGRRDGESSD